MEKKFFKWVFTNVYFYLILFIWFVIVYLSNYYTIGDWLIALPFMALVLLIPFAIFRFIYNNKNKKDFPIKGGKWFIYLLGWLGMLSLIFWIYQYFAYLIYNYDEKFFSMNFHRRTYNWGWVILVLIGITILVLMII